MKHEKFVGLLNQGKIGEILAKGGVDLTKEQLETVKYYAEKASKKELQKRQFDVAASPGYAESHILPAIREMLSKVGTESFVKAGKSSLGDKKIVKRALGSTDSKNKNSDVTDTTPAANRPTKRSSGKNINTAFYSTISQKGAILKQGDSLANIAAKTLMLQKKMHDEKIQERESKKTEYKKMPKSNKNKDKTYSKIGKNKKEKKEKRGNNVTKIGKYYAVATALVLLPSIAEAAFTEMGDMVKGFSDKLKDMLKPPADAETPSSIGDLGVGGSEEVTNMDELKKFISGKESGGNYNRLVTAKAGDASLPDEFKDINLSNMTIDEVTKLQDKMLKSGLFPSSALGKYQFTKASIQEAAKDLNIDTKTTLYTPKVQEMFMDTRLKKDIKQVKSLGLPATQGNVYLNFFAGSAGFKKIMAAPDTANVGEVLDPESAKANPRIAKKTVGQLKQDFGNTPTVPSSAATNKVAPQPTPMPAPIEGKNIERDSRPVADMANKDKVKVATVIQEKSFHYISPNSGGGMIFSDGIYEPKADLITK
jgi:hypothetical protein